MFRFRNQKKQTKLQWPHDSHQINASKMSSVICAGSRYFSKSSRGNI